MGYVNPFLILGLHPKIVKETPNSGLKALVDAQYRAMSKLYHPDKKGGNEVKFRELQEAYEDLQNHIALIAFADEYRSAKRDQVEVINERLHNVQIENGQVLNTLSLFVKGVADKFSIWNLEPGWQFVKQTPIGLVVYEFGEPGLITSASQFERIDEMRSESDVPEGYYLMTDELLVRACGESPLKREEIKPELAGLNLVPGQWYQFALTDEFGMQTVYEHTRTGRTLEVAWRPVVMVRPADKSRDENSNAGKALFGQLRKAPTKAEVRSAKQIPLDLGRIYRQLETRPYPGADLVFYRPEQDDYQITSEPNPIVGSAGPIRFILPPDSFEGFTAV